VLRVVKKFVLLPPAPEFVHARVEDFRFSLLPALSHEDVDTHADLYAENVVCRAGKFRVLADVAAEV
jgi:hypothetical protein